MPQTSIQRKSSYYDKIINEKSEVAFSPEYEKVRETLKSLVEYSRELNNPAVKMSPQDHRTLAQRYYAVRTACDEFLKKEIGKDEKSRQGLVEDISRVVKKDLLMLYNCDVTKGVSLSEVIDNARTRKLVITKDAAKTMGGNLSSRIPVKTARDKMGFFTPSVKYNTDAKWTAQVAKFADRLEAFAPGTKKTLESLTDSDKKKDDFAEIVSTVSYDELVKEYGRDKAEDQLEGLAVTIGLVKDIGSAQKFLAKNRDLKKTLLVL